MGMTKWNYAGPPMPGFSLLLLPLVFGFTFLIAIIVSAILSFVIQSTQSMPYIFLGVTIITIYLLRGVYIGLFYNLYLWFMKRKGKHLFDRVLIRTLKYSVITFIYLPLILLIVQAFVDPQFKSQIFWFAVIFKRFYIFLSITLLIALIIEKITPEKVFKKVDKGYSQIGPLMAEIK